MKVQLKNNSNQWKLKFTEMKARRTKLSSRPGMCRFFFSTLACSPAAESQRCAEDKK
jgi:hypothetical protein